ncbi:hypothetical protein Naga_100046g28 [Nannochloropsis gaditana]|uniref:Uncharacterized protein n=1 Tax=Nannochloropsis gaditana TaxID=72520 RepID=W7U2N2_9STRA|nr:hypothetical protein Naga_100046g28 [Nannochloropsis gaditana]
MTIADDANIPWIVVPLVVLRPIGAIHLLLPLRGVGRRRNATRVQRHELDRLISASTALASGSDTTGTPRLKVWKHRS